MSGEESIVDEDIEGEYINEHGEDDVNNDGNSNEELEEDSSQDSNDDINDIADGIIDDAAVAQDELGEENDDETSVEERNERRLGLRRIRQPVNSHRNRFEREYNYLNIGSKGSKQSKWYNVKKHGRLRSARKCRGDLANAMHVIFTHIAKNDKYAHISVDKGIRRHGELALNVLLAEFGQIHKHDTFIPQMVRDLTYEQRKETLHLITMINEKRCGKVKARACVDGRKQRRYISKEDVASPTVQQESLILSLVIDARENRDVAIADVVGAYLLATMDDYVLVKLTGRAVNTMCDISKEYEQYVAVENDKRVLYLRLKEALYGCMQSAILWYDTFKSCLINIGFTLNKYDPCVANKVINGNQCTICWYVDDTKISHVDSTVVDQVIKSIEDQFG